MDAFSPALVHGLFQIPDYARQVEVLPFDAGLHPGARGAFSLWRFTDPDDPPVAYVETYEGARHPESPTQIARYRQRFERL